MNKDVTVDMTVNEVEHLVAWSRTRSVKLSRPLRGNTTETDPRKQARDRPDVAVTPRTVHYDSPPFAGSDRCTGET